MAINRFDKPVSSEYISQYTPIPFEQLYAIGKANNERVDKAYKELGDQFTKWAEFRSPSAVDTKRWYDLTIGGAQDIVNEIAANPNLMKTTEGRSKIQSFINSRPYAELSELQQSREGLIQRQKINQQLMLAGKYNPLWHDVDFTNYNTMTSGVYNDLSPLAYKSEVDLVRPYVDNLKPGFIRQEGMYDWRGVSSDRTDAEVAKNISAIYNTPEARKHIEVLESQGLSKEEAINAFTNSLYRAGREYAYEDRTVNPLAQIDYAENAKLRAAKRAGAGDEDAAGRPMRLTQSIAASGSTAYNNGVLMYTTDKNRDRINRLTDEYEDARKSGDVIAMNVIEKSLKDLRDEAKTTTPQMMFYDIFEKYKDANGVVSNLGVRNAVNEILNTFSLPSKVTAVNDLLQETIPGVSKNEVDTPWGKRRVITGSGASQLDIASSALLDIAGYKFNDNTPKQKLRNELKSGRLTDLIVMGNGNILTLPTANGFESSQIITVAIPKYQTDALNLTDGEMLAAGARRKYNKPGNAALTVENVKAGDIARPSVYNGKYTANGDARISGNIDDMYWEIDLINSIPNPEDQINAEYLDHAAYKLFLSGEYRNQLYSPTQWESYGVGYSGGDDE